MNEDQQTFQQGEEHQKSNEQCTNRHDKDQHIRFETNLSQGFIMWEDDAVRKHRGYGTFFGILIHSIHHLEIIPIA